MRCHEVMKKTVYTCKESETVQKCARLMREHNIGFVPITDENGRFVGAVTDRDLSIRVLAEGRPNSTAVNDIMTREQVVCHADDKLSEAEERMADAKKSRIVVVDSRNLPIGVISLSDIGRAERPKRAGRLFSSIVEREAPRPAAM